MTRKRCLLLAIRLKFENKCYSPRIICLILSLNEKKYFHIFGQKEKSLESFFFRMTRKRCLLLAIRLKFENKCYSPRIICLILYLNENKYFHIFDLKEQSIISFYFRMNRKGCLLLAIRLKFENKCYSPRIICLILSLNEKNYFHIFGQKEKSLESFFFRMTRKRCLLLAIRLKFENKCYSPRIICLI